MYRNTSVDFYLTYLPLGITAVQHPRPPKVLIQVDMFNLTNMRTILRMDCGGVRQGDTVA